MAETIGAFPYPVPSEVDSVLHYHEGLDPKEKFRKPSVSDDVEESAHDIPFNPTAQATKNVGVTVR